MKAILTYHSVDDSGSPISISEAAFRRHVSWLAEHGPRVVDVDELLRLPPGQSAVALTFDDAFVNFGEIVWPLLRAHGLTATLYVPTGHVGATNTWGGAVQAGIPTMRIMGWDALGRLSEEGVVLGSHTRSHAHLTRLPAAAVKDELERSSLEMRDRLGVRPAGLAYPYGSCDGAIAAQAARFYGHACTVDLRPLRAVEDPHQLPRLDAWYLKGEGMLEAWGTARLQLYLQARAAVRRCRSLLQSARIA